MTESLQKLFEKKNSKIDAASCFKSCIFVATEF